MIQIPNELREDILAKGKELYTWGFTFMKVAKFLHLEYDLEGREVRKYATYSRIYN